MNNKASALSKGKLLTNSFDLKTKKSGMKSKGQAGMVDINNVGKTTKSKFWMRS